MSEEVENLQLEISELQEELKDLTRDYKELTRNFNSLQERLEPFLLKMEYETKQRQLDKDYYFPEKK